MANNNRFLQAPFMGFDRPNTKLCVHQTLAMDPNDLSWAELISGQYFLDGEIAECEMTLEQYNQPTNHLWKPRQQATDLMKIQYGVETFSEFEYLLEKMKAKKRDFCIAEARFHGE